MADPGIKKAIVQQASLPEISVPAEGYYVRYRIISEDRNRTSHWSPIFLLQPDFTFVSGNTDLAKQSNHVNLIWDSVKIFKDNNFIRNALEYDIWLRWDRNDGGDWVYADRVEGTSTSFIIPNTYFINGVDQSNSPNRLTVEIYLKGQPISRDSSFLLVYTIGPETV